MPTLPLASGAASGGRGRLVVIAAMMIAAHLAFRAWVVLPAYFYLDDYRLVDESGREPLSVALLLEPYDAQLMPFGRLLAWVGAQPDQMSWPLLAGMSLAMSALAAASCLWMLTTLFGWRRGVLAVLALYLTTAMTVPAFVWWAAGLNQLPLQTVFFVAVASWVRHLRGDGRRWLVVTLAVLAVGLTCYVKTLLVFPVLVFVALAYFARGGPLARVLTIVRQHWASALLAVLGGAAYPAYYVSAVPQIATAEGSTSATGLGEEMIGTSFATALLGGPWQWDDGIAPVGQADPPALLVHLSWVVVAAVVAHVVLRRERTGRAWLFLLAYVAADYVLLLTTRAQVIGSITGTDLRYLTDAMCAVVLALGLATMELRGAVESSRARAEPFLVRPVATRATAALLVVVCAAGVWSTATYARIWHDRHPGKEFFQAALRGLDGKEHVDLANQYLDRRVTGAIDPQHSRSDVLLPLLSPVARFPEVTDDLHVLTDRGTVAPATIDEAAATVPGPVEGCGWSLRAPRTIDIELDRPVVDVGWWLRVDYLAANDSGLTLTAGDTTRFLNLRRGLHQAYVHVDDGFDSIRLGGSDDGVTVCIDLVVVGDAVPEEEEEER